MTNNKFQFVFFYILCIPSLLSAYDNPHFYRATNLFAPTRLEMPLLFSLDITLGQGSTKHGRDSQGNKVPLFDAFGPIRAQELGVGVPGKNLNNPLDVLLIQLEQLPRRDNFATLSTQATFNMWEANIQVYQNFDYGFFVNAHVPIRHFSIKKINFVDQSPDDDEFPNKNTPVWQQFLQSFDAILNRYNLSTAPFCQTGIGDLTILLGWTHNYQETTELDFIDVTGEIGILAPTGKAKNEDRLFALPFGYNKHWGISFNGGVSFGAFEWVTVSFFVDSIYLLKRTHAIRINSSIQQSGIVKLTTINADVKPGIVWQAGTLFEADHCICGFSAGIGYSYAAQNRFQVEPACDTPQGLFNCTAIENDQTLRGFSMHTIHMYAVYDFATRKRMWGPRLGLYYNRQISGRRTFDTNIIGGSFGLDILWSF